MLLLTSEGMISKAIQEITPCYAINRNQDKFVYDFSKDLGFYSYLFDHFKDVNPEKITGMIHLAAFSGNLNFNQKYPDKTFANNVKIGINVFTEWISYYNKKAINVVPSCAYPDIPILSEEKFWDGPSNYTIESHGLARRCVEAYTRQLNKTGAKIITCVVNNSSGPYDSFNIEKTKVIGGLITKFYEATLNNSKEVVCWGTGNVKREFIYSKDVAKCLLQAFEKYENYYEPINITSGQEITIKELAEKIAKICNFKGDIVWDTSKPDGQNQKKLSTKKMEKYIDVEFTPLDTWLKETVDWYAKNRDTCR